MKYIHNESANLTDRCNVAFNANNGWNQAKTVPVTGMESTLTRTSLRYTRDNMPTGICSLVKPATLAKLNSYPIKIIAVML